MTKNKGGAPKGNNNAGKGRKATRALHYVLDTQAGEFNFDFEPTHPLVAIWKKQIELAKEGDKDATKLIVERLDGKAHQSMALEAEITTRSAKELTDDELAAIIRDGRS